MRVLKAIEGWLVDLTFRGALHIIIAIIMMVFGGIMVMGSVEELNSYITLHPDEWECTDSVTNSYLMWAAWGPSTDDRVNCVEYRKVQD